MIFLSDQDEEDLLSFTSITQKRTSGHLQVKSKNIYPSHNLTQSGKVNQAMSVHTEEGYQINTKPQLAEVERERER